MRKRPVHLDLFTLRFPITAIASILHRFSGFVLFLLIPLCLKVLALSLSSSEEFFLVRRCFGHPLNRIIILGFLCALFYHLLAGVRHLFMDGGFGEDLKSARRSAGLVMGGTVLLTVLAGVYLW